MVISLTEEERIKTQRLFGKTVEELTILEFRKGYLKLVKNNHPDVFYGKEDDISIEKKTQDFQDLQALCERIKQYIGEKTTPLEPNFNQPPQYKTSPTELIIFEDINVHPEIIEQHKKDSLKPTTIFEKIIAIIIFSLLMGRGFNIESLLCFFFTTTIFLSCFLYEKFVRKPKMIISNKYSFLVNRPFEH